MNGGYELGNCRWATGTEQRRNKRNTVFVEFRGDRWKLVELCEASGAAYPLVASRLRNGWGIEAALFTPKRGA